MKIYQPLCISVVLLIILLYVFLLNSPVIFDTKPLPQRHLKGSVHLGTHSAYGKWRFFPYPDYKLSLYKIIPLIRTKNPTTINFKDISWKGKHDPKVKMNSDRYKDADTRFPGILVKGAPNPDNLPYRMIDGAHRITKLTQWGRCKGNFYVLSYPELLKTLHMDMKKKR